MNTNIQKFKLLRISEMIENSNDQNEIKALREEAKKIEGMLALNKFGIFAHKEVNTSLTTIINQI